ncbi:uncharacterized protein LOC131942899 [Physella acuta]|uniref:uncharacterized protein LOC131942899 n=1 Tax=Physella acuta TaxID=109671 RepID=UPI0027DBE155|nr:uncharacterized protein LOC131942899 [Physella acuta]
MLYSEADDYDSDQPNSPNIIIGAMLLIAGFILIVAIFRAPKVMEINITDSEQNVANTNTNCNMDVNNIEILVSELHDMQTDGSLLYLGEFTGRVLFWTFTGTGADEWTESWRDIMKSTPYNNSDKSSSAKPNHCVSPPTV